MFDGKIWQLYGIIYTYINYIHILFHILYVKILIFEKLPMYYTISYYMTDSLNYIEYHTVNNNHWQWKIVPIKNSYL